MAPFPSTSFGWISAGTILLLASAAAIPDDGEKEESRRKSKGVSLVLNYCGVVVLFFFPSFPAVLGWPLLGALQGRCKRDHFHERKRGARAFHPFF